MPAKLKPQKFRIEGCPKVCSLSVEKLGNLADSIHSFYEMGDNDKTISEKAYLLGVKISSGAAGRHRANHLIPVMTAADKLIAATGAGYAGVDPDKPIEKVDDLTVLERIISKGATTIDLATSRISPEMTIRAIELKYKLTQGSAFESFLAAIGGTMEEVTGRGHDPDAEASEEEQAQSAEEVPVVPDPAD